MVKLKIFLVSYDSCEQKAVAALTKEERSDVYCYAVGKHKLKLITAKIKRINEWELPWHDNRYQFLQYYEFGFFPHIVKNPSLSEDLTHIGILHNDVLFHKNSINEIYNKLEDNPDIIFYIIKRNNALYFNDYQLTEISKWLEPRLNIKINTEKIKIDGWISETMALAPKAIFIKFGEFLLKYQFEIEALLSTNKWGLMDIVKHRNCGFVERLWGIFLVSYGLPIKRMEIDHDRENYEHQSLVDKQKFLNNL